MKSLEEDLGENRGRVLRLHGSMRSSNLQDFGADDERVGKPKGV